MHKYKQYTRLFVFSIIAFIFLFPIIYLIVFSVFHSDTGFSLMNYYKVFLAKPDYLIKFWRSLAMCLMIAAGQTLFSCMSGTAFAKYSFPLKKFWFILFALFMILPIQVTLLPNYILLEKLKLLNSWKALIIPAIFSPFGTVWLTFSRKRNRLSPFCFSRITQSKCCWNSIRLWSTMFTSSDIFLFILQYRIDGWTKRYFMELIK